MRSFNQKMRAARKARGFSLLELMLVLAIIATLMAVAAWNFLGQGEKARTKATKQTLFTIKSAMAAYNLEYASFPPDLRTLITTKILADQKLKDGWDHDLYYDTRGASKDRPYNLRSPGSDNQLGNEDDVDVWAVNQ
jgi:prepilin-type N-terminal cleavage/methylation domain-containing protein